MFELEGPVAWSPRRRGQVLVVVGVLLGALGGVVLGLAVDEPQRPTAVAAPVRAGGAALAAHPPGSQPTASESTGSGGRADGDAAAGGQRTKPADRPGNRRGDAGGSEGRRGKPSKAKPDKDKGKPDKANGR
jgi:hypothetical protein